MAAAGAGPGSYTLGPHVLSVAEDGIVREPGASNFAGSSLTLDTGAMNFARYTGISAEEAWVLVPRPASGKRWRCRIRTLKS